MSGLTKKIKAGLVQLPREQFVGEPGTIFYDPEIGDLYLSDGVTLGGNLIMSGGGNTGYTGSQGVNGTNGYTGSQGNTGYVGSGGATGASGVQGPTGYTGSAGSDGAIGYTGSAGSTGAPGNDGNTGATGPIGYTGSAGANGSNGTTGFTGSVGPAADLGNWEFRNDTMNNLSGGQINNADTEHGATAGVVLPANGDIGAVLSVFNIYGRAQIQVANLANSATTSIWSFGADGNLILPEFDFTASPAITSGITFGDGTYQHTASIAGATGPQGPAGATGYTGSQGGNANTGNIVFNNDILRNTTSLGGEVNIETASQQGDPNKTWSFNHDGAGSLYVPTGSSIKAEQGLSILATEPSFVNFTNVRDFDTNSYIDFDQISIVNPEAGILALINPTSPNYAGGVGATIRFVYRNYLVKEVTLVEGFAANGNDPVTGLPQYTCRVDFNTTIMADLIKEISFEHSANWRFAPDGKLQLPLGGDIVDSTGNSVLVTNQITNTDGYNTFKVSVATTGVISMNTGRGGIEFGAMPEIGGPTHLHIMRPAGQNASTDLFFGDDYNYVKLPGLYGVDPNAQQGVEIGSSLNEGNVSIWKFGTNGTTTFPSNKIKAPISNNLSIETEPLPTLPPNAIVISGADFVAVNLTYTKDGGNSIWYPPGYDPATDPYIEFTGGQWGIFVPGFGQALYVNTGTVNVPLAQWDTNPPLGSVAPTGVYTYPTSFTRTWTFGTDRNLTGPAGSGILNLQNIGVSEYQDLSVKFYKGFPFTTEQTLTLSPSGLKAFGGTAFIQTSSSHGLLISQIDKELSIGDLSGNGFFRLKYGSATPQGRIGDAQIYTLPFIAGSEPSVWITANGTVNWRFRHDGAVVFPDTTVQTTAFTGNATTVDITNTNGLTTTYYLTFVENRSAEQTVRADVDLTYRTDDNLLSAKNINTGILKIDDGVHEKFQTKADATGIVEHDCSAGHIFYHTSPDANWTANFTNLNLSTGYVTAVSLIIVQGVTGYYPTVVQIGGVSQTINWQGNTNPTPSSSRTDVVTFSIINEVSGYTVLGQLTGF